MAYVADVLVGGYDMQGYVGRTGVNHLEYHRQAEALAHLVDVGRQLVVRCGASIALFAALCAAWALVFGVALR